MFDDVLLLGKGGYTIFLGPNDQVLPYFERLGFICPERSNPSDFLLDVINGDIPREGHPDFHFKQLPDLWNKHHKSIKHPSAPVIRVVRGVSVAEAAVGTVLPLTGAVAVTLPGSHPRGHRRLPTEDVDGANIVVLEDSGNSIDEDMESPSQMTEMNLINDESSEFVAIESIAALGTADPEERKYTSCAELCSRSGACGVLNLDFWIGFIFSSVGILYLDYMQKSIQRRYTALFGAMCGSVMFLIAAAVFFFFAAIVSPSYLPRSGSPPWLTIAALFCAAVMLAGAGLIVYAMVRATRRTLKRKMTKRDVEFLLTVWLCLWTIIPFGSLYSYLKTKTTSRIRIAAQLGAAIHIIGLCSIVIFISVDPAMVISMFMAILLATVLIIVFFHRISTVPIVDRVTAGFAAQLRLFTVRGLAQHLVDWRSVVFDIGICIASGILLGIIFYEKSYVGPAGSTNPDIGQVCTRRALLPANFTAEVAVICDYPQKDPVFPEASLSGLAISLAAVASSLRIFGAEKANFARESSVGSSTEAYYFGKTLSHMPIVLIAPLAFLLPFYFMAALHASFIEMYLCFTLLYVTSSGMAYFISILLKDSISQLVGVLSVLVFMFFSGGQPRLPELQGTVLMYPTYLSFVRWSQELYYTTEIAQYQVSGASVDGALGLYGYSLRQHWNWRLWFYLAAHAIFFRLCAYVALVKREQ
jgi:hypothetical protein